MPLPLRLSSRNLHQFDRLSFVMRGRARGGFGGDHEARRRAQSTDFVDYRPYQPGDDFRRIDWNLYGRLGTLEVKLTQARERLDVLVVLDCSASMACGLATNLQFAVELGAALAYVGMLRADSVRIAYIGADEAKFGPFAGRAQLRVLLDSLARIAPGGAVDLNTSLERCISGANASGTLVVLVSDLLAPGGIAPGLESLLARKVEVAVVHVVGEDQLDPHFTGEVSLVDAESGEAIELGVSLETLAAYRGRFQRWLDECQAQCRMRGVRYARVRSDRPLATAMLDDLRSAGILR